MRLRFRIRALVLVVFVLGVILGIGALTLENRRLRADIRRVRAEVALANFNAEAVTAMSQVVVFRYPDNAGKDRRPMPNGSDAFADQSGNP